jgi:cell wall assembly regulator SMI1
MENVTREWNRIEAWLKTNLSEVIADLNPPASEDAIKHAEEVIGVEFPDSFKALYRIHDGQRQDVRGAFFGQWFMGLERMLMRYADWKGIVVHDPEVALGANHPFTSTPEGAIQLCYADAAWVPFTEDGLSGHFGLDFNPGERGHVGQVIMFGRYVDNKLVASSDLPSFLGWVADELERGKGHIYEAVGLKLFDHADLTNAFSFEDGLRTLLYGPRSGISP